MTAERPTAPTGAASCAEALAALTSNSLRVDDQLPPGVGGHVRDCPACRARLAQLAAAVLNMRDDEITCAACETWLPRFVASDADDRAASRDLRLVSEHLSSCSACAEEASLLAGAMELLDAGLPSAPASMPEFDLSFLAATQDHVHPERRPGLVRPAVFVGAAATAGVLGRIRTMREAFRTWADRRAHRLEDRGPVAQARSVGVLVPLVVLLALALGVLWAAMKAVPAMPDLVTARQTAAAQRAGTATAQGLAAATASARTRTETAMAPEAATGPSTGSGRAAVHTATPRAASPTPTNASTPTTETRPEPEDGRRSKAPARPTLPTGTIDARTPTPRHPSETAYPRWPSDPPPTGYPPPGTESPRAPTPASTTAPGTPTPSTPRPVTPSPSAPRS